MSATPVSAQDVSTLYTGIRSICAICALLVYDWFLCLGQEFKFIWRWRSGVSFASLVYACNRYPLLIQGFLALRTAYPMSDWVRDLHLATILLFDELIVACRANIWLQIATGVLTMMAFGAFSALRAYALSNRNIWLTAVIFLLAVPPSAMAIVQGLYEAPANLPSPFDCSASTSLSRTLSMSINVVWRVSQFAAELLVVSITWWYTYQSYRIRKGVKLGQTISSLLIYNGSLYFLFLATLYILGIIFNTTSILGVVGDATSNLGMFYDPIAAILTCRFMLSLRRFDSTMASPTYFATGSRIRGQAASTVLQFAAQPSDTLPAFIASFAHPVHVNSSLTDSDGVVDEDDDNNNDDGSEWREMDAVMRSPHSKDTVLSEAGP